MWIQILAITVVKVGAVTAIVVGRVLMDFVMQAVAVKVELRRVYHLVVYVKGEV
jgi:hypothetical protein